MDTGATFDNLQLPRAATLARQIASSAAQPAAWAARVAAGPLVPPAVSFGPRLVGRLGWSAERTQLASRIVERHNAGEREPAAVDLPLVGQTDSQRLPGGSWPAPVRPAFGSSPSAGFAGGLRLDPLTPEVGQPVDYRPSNPSLARAPAEPPAAPLLADLAAHRWGEQMPLPPPARPETLASTSGAPTEHEGQREAAEPTLARSDVASAPPPVERSATQLPGVAGPPAEARRTTDSLAASPGGQAEGSTDRPIQPGSLPLASLRSVALRRPDQPDALARMGWSTAATSPRTSGQPPLTSSAFRMFAGSLRTPEQSPLPLRRIAPETSEPSGHLSQGGAGVTGPERGREPASVEGVAREPAEPQGLDQQGVEQPSAGFANSPQGDLAPALSRQGELPTPSTADILRLSPAEPRVSLRPAPFALGLELAVRPARTFPVARAALSRVSEPSMEVPGNVAIGRTAGGEQAVTSSYGPAGGPVEHSLAPSDTVTRGIDEPTLARSAIERAPAELPVELASSSLTPSPAARFAGLVLRRATAALPAGGVAPVPEIGGFTGDRMPAETRVPEQVHPGDPETTRWSGGTPGDNLRPYHVSSPASGGDVRPGSGPTGGPVQRSALGTTDLTLARSPGSWAVQGGYAGAAPPPLAPPPLELARAPVQRAAEPVGAAMPPDTPAAPATAAAATPSGEDKANQPSVEELAQKVYDHLRRRMLIEHERRGRPL